MYWKLFARSLGTVLPDPAEFDHVTTSRAYGVEPPVPDQTYWEL
jgi:hypothetical protein